MEGLLKTIEKEELVFYIENCYDESMKRRCWTVFTELKENGILLCDYSHETWNIDTTIKHFMISFTFDEVNYKTHAYKFLKISINDIKDMLKCYALFHLGSFIIPSISNRINVVKSFLTQFGASAYQIDTESLSYIKDFLLFIGTEQNLIKMIVNHIHVSSAKVKKSRVLSNLINYLVVENEINQLFSTEGNIEEKIKYFPIFFWVNITFIIPLRATEMLVTPFDCIYKEGDKVYLRVRRTKLKKGLRKVYYDVEKDYQLYSHEITNSNAVAFIQKYQDLTRQHDRRFLFDYNQISINNMLSLQAFNHLLAEFIETRLIGNPNYDFVKYVTNIDEFEVITAGDSRHIAMSNLYFQNVGADICRQLAGHVNIDTSASYYTNVSETLEYASVIQLQNLINKKTEKTQKETEFYLLSNKHAETPVCLSEKRLWDLLNLEDCIEQGCMENCFGCKFYIPSLKEIENEFLIEQEKVDRFSQSVIDYINNINKLKGKETDIEKLFLKVHTHGTRFKICCDIKNKEILEKWLENQYLTKKNY